MSPCCELIGQLRDQLPTVRLGGEPQRIRQGCFDDPSQVVGRASSCSGAIVRQSSGPHLLRALGVAIGRFAGFAGRGWCPIVTFMGHLRR